MRSDRQELEPGGMATTGRAEGPSTTAAGVLDHRRPAPDGEAAAASPSAADVTPMTSLRWALAFYAAFAFLPLGTAFALWLGP